MKKIIEKIKGIYFTFIRKQFAKQYPVFSMTKPYYNNVKKGDVRYKYLITTFFVNGKPNDIDILVSRHDKVIAEKHILENF